MADSTPKQEPPYGLRMPPDLKARVKAAADANNRSMNAEIVATLEEKYPPPRDTLPLDMRLLVDYLRLVESAESDEERAAFLESVNEGLRSEPALSAFRIGVTTDLDGQIVPFIGKAKTDFEDPIASSAPRTLSRNEESSSEVRDFIASIARAEMHRFPAEPPPSVADVLDLVEEELERILSPGAHDATRRALLLGARDELAERAKTDPDAPVERESARRRAARAAARDIGPEEPVEE